jgi:hypothetical protein
VALEDGPSHPEQSLAPGNGSGKAQSFAVLHLFLHGLSQLAKRGGMAATQAL